MTFLALAGGCDITTATAAIMTIATTTIAAITVLVFKEIHLGKKQGW
jgi:hypothetical protein